MRSRSAPVLALLLVAVVTSACKSEPKPGAADPVKPAEPAAATATAAAAAPAEDPTCARVVDHVVELMVAQDGQAPDARAGIMKRRPTLVTACLAEHLNKAQVDCITASKSLGDVGQCQNLKEGDAPPAATPDATATAAPSIDELAAGLAADKVTAAFGEPAKQSDVVAQGADDTFYTEWTWPAKGLRLGMGSNVKQGPFVVSTVTCDTGCTLRTGKGIGVGATVAEVKTAYGKAINKKASNAKRLVVGEDLGGTFFNLKDGKVASIFMGAAGE